MWISLRNAHIIGVYFSTRSRVSMVEDCTSVASDAQKNKQTMSITQNKYLESIGFDPKKSGLAWFQVNVTELDRIVAFDWIKFCTFKEGK
jgi:hypothetical protein